MDRHFPLGRPRRKTPRRGVRAAVLTGVVLAVAAGLLSPALADREDDLKDRADHLDGRVHSARGHLEHSSKQLQRATAALQSSRERLQEARAALADTLGKLAAAEQLDAQMRRALAAAEQRLATAEAELADSEDDVTAAEGRIEEFAVEAYAGSDAGLMSMDAILHGESTMQFPQMMSSAESVVSAQTAAMDDLDAARILMTLREERVQELRNDVAVKRRLAADNLDRKQALTRSARAERAAVRSLVGERQSARARAQRARQHDVRVLQRMERDRERVEDMLRRVQIRQQRRIEARQEARQQARQEARQEARQAARQQARDTAPAPTTSSGSGGTSGSSGSSAGDGGGYLDYPTPGAYVTSPYGMRRHPTLGVVKLHDGTDFGASCGTPIYAAASGRVMGAYFNAGYGNRVIVSHGVAQGVSLATSYNHLSDTAVSSGEQVERGEVIGYVGTTGYSTGCHLHFMVYSNGSTVDPAGWL